MNSATKNLENDHVYILRLIDVMEVITQSNNPNVQDLETIVYLIKNYADGFHHEKEEKLLFPLLGEKGFSPDQGPVSVMLMEHEHGRTFVKGIASGIESYKAGNQGAVHEILRNMEGYIVLLRNHISKENNILFRMADKVFSEEDHQALLKEFSRVENSGVCGGALSDCIASIQKLEKSYELQPSK